MQVAINIPESVIEFSTRQGVTLGEDEAKTITIENNGALEVHYEIGVLNQSTSFFYDGTQMPPKPSPPSEAASRAHSANLSVASSRMSWGKASSKGSRSVVVGKLGQEEEEEEELASIW